MMKFISVFFLLFSFTNLKAQWHIADCDFFCVEKIRVDSLNTSNLNVTIKYIDTVTNHVNYPYVKAVLLMNGDTLSKSGQDFFAHNGGSTQVYNTTRTGIAVPDPLFATVVYSYSTGSSDTSCTLEYPCVYLGAQEKEIFDDLVLYPNPSSDFINLRAQDGIKEVRLVDTFGRTVYIRNEVSKQMQIPVIDLPNGIYILQINGLKKRNDRVVVLK